MGQVIAAVLWKAWCQKMGQVYPPPRSYKIISNFLFQERSRCILRIFNKTSQCPHNKFYVLQKSVDGQSHQPHSESIKSPVRNLKKSAAVMQPAQRQWWKQETYAISLLPSTLNSRFTAWGCNSLSTSITCFAIEACSGDANGTSTLLYSHANVVRLL